MTTNERTRGTGTVIGLVAAAVLAAIAWRTLRPEGDGRGGPSAPTAVADADGGDAETTVTTAGRATPTLRIVARSGSTPMATAVVPIDTGDDLDALAPADRYRRGEALLAEGRYEAAVLAFESYGAAVPEMIDVAQLAAGNARFAGGRHDEAAAAFAMARDRAGPGSSGFLAALRLGNARLRTGPAAAALAAYADAHGRAEDDDQRAQALAGTIAVHVTEGEVEAATEVRRRMVRELPGATLAASALERLAEAGEAAPPAEAAAVLVATGDAWAAINLLVDAGAAESGAPTEMRLALARAYRAAGEHALVVDVAEAVLAGRPGDDAAAESAAMRAAALGALGDERGAADAWFDLADRWPASDGAASAAWTWARLVERLDGPVAGAGAWSEAARRFPADRRAPDARFRAAFLAWTAGDGAGAEEGWSGLAAAGAGPDRARASFWLGRLASDRGDDGAAERHWRAAVEADRDGFYGLRSAGRLGLDRPEPAAAPAADGAADIGHWLVGWRPGLDEAAWAAAREDVAGGRGLRRAAAWLDLGERRAALDTLRAARAEMRSDPVARAALAIEAARLGLYDVAVAAAANVLAAAPAGAAAAPVALWRLRYPDGFGELVRGAAAAEGLAPALLFGLVLQESRFEPTATSSAGARGLTQVMPATGRQIADRLGVAGFSAGDLYEPELAVRFGAWYLADLLRQSDGSEVRALAGYNGGPGNAGRWSRAAGADDDLFVELIDLEETRRFVRAVTAHRAQYERAYPDFR